MDKNKNGIGHLLAMLPPWLLSGLTAAAICWLTLSPDPLGDVKPELFPGADKVVHAVMFGGLELMLVVDMMRRRGWRRVSRGFLLFSGLGTSLFGVIIEILQRWMNLGRSFDIIDIVADVSGVAAVILLCIIFRVYAVSDHR